MLLRQHSVLSAIATLLLVYYGSSMIGITRTLAWCPIATRRRRLTVLSSLPDPLFDAVFSRVKRTLGERKSGDNNNGHNAMLDEVINRVEQGISQERRGGDSPNASPALLDAVDATILPRATATIAKTTPVDSILPEQEVPTTDQPRYKSHPAITATALAHTLWASVVRPGNDTVIDATAGNGYDTVQLARLLLPTIDDLASSSELIAMDIQPQACQATRAALDQYLSSIASSYSTAVDQHEEENESIIDATRVLCQSHETIPPTTNPIGLIAYNLGYLPGSAAKDIQTDAESTLASLAAAAPRVRKGGLVSIVVYPDSAPSVDIIRDTLTTWAATGKWRCREHAALGLSQPSPVLYTALRIKPDGDSAAGAF